MDDPRNELFREYIRLLRGFKPKVFVMENVSGMVKGKMAHAFVEILAALKECGYKVSARLLSTAFFGVPQARQRMIFIGVREDLNIEPSHPAAQTRLIPIREIFPPPYGDGAPFPDEGHPEPPQLTPKYRAMAPLILPGECAADHDPGKGFQNLVRLYIDRPSPTLTKMNPGNGRGTPLHPVEHRSVNIPEALRIGSFPDDWKMFGPFVERWARIGNSVPPFLMRAIALHVRQHILHV